MFRRTTLPNAGLFAAPIVRARAERDLRGAAVRLQRVRPTARPERGRRVEPVLGLVSRRRADRVRSPVRPDELRVDDAGGRAGEDRRQLRRRDARLDHDRVLVLRRHLEPGEDVRRIALEVDEPSEREDHVGGRQRRTVGEVDSLPQPEREPLCAGARPGPDQQRDRVPKTALPVREKSVVDSPIDDVSRRGKRPLRIGRVENERSCRRREWEQLPSGFRRPGPRSRLRAHPFPRATGAGVSARRKDSSLDQPKLARMRERLGS